MSKIDPKTTPNLGSSLGELKMKGWTDYLIIIRERWLVALTLAIALPSLYLYYQIQQPRIFAASAFLIVEPSADQIVNIEQVVNLNTLDEAVMQVHESQLRSNVFSQNVFDSFSAEERQGLLKPYREEWGIEAGKETVSNVARVISKGLNIERFERKYTFAIQMRHRDPAMAALVANQYVDQYQDYLLERAKRSNLKAIGFLQDEERNTETLMDGIWEEIRKWREGQGLVSLKEQQEFIQAKRKEVSSILTSIEHEHLTLESKIKLLKQQIDSGRDPFENPDVISFGTLGKLKEEKEDLIHNKSLLERKYLQKHPSVVENARSIDSLDRRIQLNIKALSRKLGNELDEVKSNEAKLKTQLAEVDNDAKLLNVLSVKADRLQFEIESNKDSLKAIKERRRDIEITNRIESLNVKIADRAYPKSQPIEPNIRKISVLSAVMAFLLFIGVPIGLDSLDNKVKNSWDITQFLKVEILAQVGPLSKIPKPDRMNIARKGLDHAVVESFRSLYSQIGMHSNVEYPKTILITSTIPEEGKSMLACNMASVFGRHGHKTLLIDLDLRRPALHRSFNLKNNNGIIHYLKEKETFPGPLVKDPSLGIHVMEPNVHLMCAGGHSQDATEVIVSNDFKGLLDALKEEYSLIILDTPPLGVFPDALLLSEMADEIIYMIRHGKPRRTAVQNMIHRLRGAQSELLGVVVNDLPPKKAYYYYSQYGYYSYYTYRNYQKYYQNAEKG